jgi:hypothetical protein
MPLSFGDAFNVAVYAQPYVWLLLLNSRVKLSMYMFYFVGAVTAALLAYTGFSRGFYSTDILICYVFMVMYAAWRSRGAEPIHAVSFAFIIVFANSYFWELPIHFAAFMETFQVGNQIIQATHLLPLVLLVYLYRDRLTLLPWAKAFDRSLLLWILVFGVTYTRMMVIGESSALSLGLNHLLRWIALFTLTSIISLRPETSAQ